MKWWLNKEQWSLHNDVNNEKIKQIKNNKDKMKVHKDIYRVIIGDKDIAGSSKYALHC